MKKCIKCTLDKDFIYYHKNKLESDGYSSRCKLCRKLDTEIYYQSNKENKKKQTNAYYYANKDKIRIVKRKYQQRKEKEDIGYKLARRLRNRLYYALKRTYWKKGDNFNNYIGCTREELKAYIEQQFTTGMNWNNYGKWEIDHIIPLSSAELPEDMYKLCHYTNLQPLWKLDNIIKGNKI